MIARMMLIAIGVLPSTGLCIEFLFVGSANTAQPGGLTKLGPPIPYYSGMAKTRLVQQMR